MEKQMINDEQLYSDTDYEQDYSGIGNTDLMQSFRDFMADKANSAYTAYNDYQDALEEQYKKDDYDSYANLLENDPFRSMTAEEYHQMTNAARNFVNGTVRFGEVPNFSMDRAFLNNYRSLLDNPTRENLLERLAGKAFISNVDHTLRERGWTKSMNADLSDLTLKNLDRFLMQEAQKGNLSNEELGQLFTTFRDGEGFGIKFKDAMDRISKGELVNDNNFLRDAYLKKTFDYLPQSERDKIANELLKDNMPK